MLYLGSISSISSHNQVISSPQVWYHGSITALISTHRFTVWPRVLWIVCSVRYNLPYFHQKRERPVFFLFFTRGCFWNKMGATGNEWNGFHDHMAHKSHFYHWIIHLECSTVLGWSPLYCFSLRECHVGIRKSLKNIPLFCHSYVFTLSLFLLENVIVKVQGVGISERSSVFDMLSCKYPFDGYLHFLSACCVRDLFCFKYNLWYVSRRQSLTDCSSYTSQ